MNLDEFKLNNLGVDKEKFGRIYSFVDFGNVNYWYEKDRRDANENILDQNQKLIVDIGKLAQFLDLFSEQKRFYYGWHQRLRRSQHIIVLARNNKFITITKPIQFIKHYLEGLESDKAKSGVIKEDSDGKFIEIQKSNFDVEISIDAFRLLGKYDTFCLLSGDSDFAKLTEFLIRNGKKIIVMASGQVFHTLRDAADSYINAQKIKAMIAVVKETPPL